MRYGKHPRKNDYRTLKFKNYSSQLADPPAEVYQLNRTKAPVKTLFPMSGNDKYGCCTVAASAHAITLYRIMAQQSVLIANEKDVVKKYFSLTGGVDSGLNSLDVLCDWRKDKYLNANELVAFASVNPTNKRHVQQAIHLFGGLYIGFQVTKNTMIEFRTGMPWQSAKLLPEGHAVFVTGYNDIGPTGILTWGGVTSGTWEWWEDCVEECFVLLPDEAKSVSFAPGFNFMQLKEDLAEITD